MYELKTLAVYSPGSHLEAVLAFLRPSCWPGFQGLTEGLHSISHRAGGRKRSWSMGRGPCSQLPYNGEEERENNFRWDRCDNSKKSILSNFGNLWNTGFLRSETEPSSLALCLCTYVTLTG